MDIDKIVEDFETHILAKMLSSAIQIKGSNAMAKKKVRKSTTIDMVTAPPVRDPNIKKKQSPEQQDKVSRVMEEFKNGKLKSSSGKTVTNKDQAIAIALHQAGISNKSLVKAEILNKIRVLKAQAQRLLYKEMAKDESIEVQLIEYFKTHKNPNDSEVHALAEKLNISPHDLEKKIYGILSSFLSGGLSEGKTKAVDEKELSMGQKVELEHSDDPALADKIARDHLEEDPEYYSKLKAMEASGK